MGSSKKVGRIAHVSSKSGTCDCCGRRLRAVGLTEGQRRRTWDALLGMAAESAVRGTHCGVVVATMAAATSGRITRQGQEDEATDGDKKDVLARIDKLSEKATELQPSEESAVTEAEAEAAATAGETMVISKALEATDTGARIQGGWGRRIGAGGDLEHFVGWLAERQREVRYNFSLYEFRASS